jgi:hypothetical protein
MARFGVEYPSVDKVGFSRKENLMPRDERQGNDPEQ